MNELLADGNDNMRSRSRPCEAKPSQASFLVPGASTTTLATRVCQVKYTTLTLAQVYRADLPSDASKSHSVPIYSHSAEELRRDQGPGDMNAASSVAVFWDYENCALPATEPCYMIVNKIRRLAHQYGSVKTFKAYLEYPEQTTLKSMALRSELQSCGVSLIDCPHNGRKDVADKMMMIDMMAHAIDNPAPATIILISGDRDFVYAVSILSLRQYRIVLLAPRSAHSGLKGQADIVYNWPDDFLPELPAIALSATCPPPPSGQERRLSRATPMALQEYPTNQFLPALEAPTTTQRSSFAASSSAKGVLDVDLPASATSTGGQIDVDLEYPHEDLSANPTPPPVTQTDGIQSAAPPPGSETNESQPTPMQVAEDGEILQSEASESVPRQIRGEASSETAPLQPVPGLPSRPPGLAGWTTREPSSSSTAQLSFTQPGLSFGSFGIGTTSSPFGLNAHASPFVQPSAVASSSTLTTLPKTWASLMLPPKPRTTPADDADDADPTQWQTFSRAAAAKKRATHVPAEFKPLVKVLKRQLAAGCARVESSQLGTLLSAEAAPLSALYERAGVARLKEYTALAADVGIVTLSRESVDGHNYVALHPVHRRKGVEHVWG